MDIFCQIINKKAQSYVVSETENTIAVLDIEPQTNGHTLVIPKTHFQDLNDMPDNIYCEMFTHAKNIGSQLKNKFGYKTYRILAVVGDGQDVPHAHVHVIGLGIEKTQLMDLASVFLKFK